jgi:hypothetical protein
VLKDIYNRLAKEINRLDTHKSNGDGAGKKHIPTNGDWNNTLKYESSGTAVWTPSPYTYRKVSASLTYNNWYKVAYCNFSSSDKYSGGSALITVHAYDGSGKEQTVVCRANYIGGSSKEELTDNTKCYLEVVSSVYRGTKLFSSISQVSFNTGFIALKAASTTSSLIINITVESSISEGRVDFKANDNDFDTTVDGTWVWSHSGQHYWTDYDI